MAKLNDLVLLGLFAALCATFSEAFAVHPRQNPAAISRSTALKMSDNDDEKLKALGYTADEITRSRKESDKEEIKVR